MSVTPMFQGEVQLAGWSESHNGGCKVTFWLADPSDLDAFRAMTVRKGNTAGQRLACVLVEIGDDEQPVPPQPKAEPEKPKGGPLAKLAGMWCNDAQFVEWMRRTYCGTWTKAQIEHPNDAPDDWAAYVIRELCHISSRAELDSDPEAAQRFQLAVRGPYMAAMGGSGA